MSAFVRLAVDLTTRPTMHEHFFWMVYDRRRIGPAATIAKVHTFSRPARSNIENPLNCRFWRLLAAFWAVDHPDRRHVVRAIVWPSGDALPGRAASAGHVKGSRISLHVGRTCQRSFHVDGSRRIVSPTSGPFVGRLTLDIFNRSNDRTDFVCEICM